MKTKGFDIEAERVAEDGLFENLTTATMIAAIQVLQMVRERDGAAGRPLQDALDPGPRWRRFANASKARPRNRRTLVPKGRSGCQLGCVRDLADGQVTTANQDPL